MGLSWGGNGSHGISKALICGEVRPSHGETPVLWSSLLVSLLLSCFYKRMEMAVSLRGVALESLAVLGWGDWMSSKTKGLLGFPSISP